MFGVLIVLLKPWVRLHGRRGHRSKQGCADVDATLASGEDRTAGPWHAVHAWKGLCGARSRIRLPSGGIHDSHATGGSLTFKFARRKGAGENSVKQPLRRDGLIGSSLYITMLKSVI